MACVDQTPATAEYKLLQLKQCLAGEALRAIEGLGHSAAAYQAAKRGWRESSEVNADNWLFI